MKIDKTEFELLEDGTTPVKEVSEGNRIGFLWLGGAFFLLWLISVLLPEALAQRRYGINLAPSLHFPMGTDSLGRSILFRMIKGFCLTSIIAFLGGCAEFFIGGLYGTGAAVAPRWLGNLLMRVLDIISSVPYLLLVTLIILASGNTPAGVVGAIVLTGWMPTSRVVRGAVLRVQEENYIKASRLMGASSFFLIRKHIFPEILGILMTSVILNIPKYIFAEAFLSFLGLGFSYPSITWGMILAEGQENIFFYPYQLVLPGIILITLLLTLTIAGERMKRRVDGAHWRGYYG